MSQLVLAGEIYKHYKGNNYKVLCIAKHTETLEQYVVYEQLYGDGSTWIRPYNMFIENVIVDDKIVPRFKHITDIEK
jgi:hypothetical protein